MNILVHGMMIIAMHLIVLIYGMFVVVLIKVAQVQVRLTLMVLYWEQVFTTWDFAQYY
jgi:hypothetical protein